MKKIRPVMLVAGLTWAVCQSASASLLVGFHDFDENATDESADYSAVAGFSGNVNKDGETSRIAGGSSPADTFYGNSAVYSVPSVAGGDGFARMIDSALTFSFTNGTSNTYSIAGLLFDATISTTSGSFNLAYKIGSGGSYSNSTTYGPGGITTTSDTANNALVQNYSDFFRSLTNVALDAGETIFFQFTATGSSSGVRIDNVGLVGELSPIPEPGSLVALGGLVGAGCFLRSRRRPLRVSAF